MSSAEPERSRPTTTRDFLAKKERGEKVAVLTCYDHLFARLLGATEVDAVLVGDSVGQAILGYDSTLPVTLEEMIHHASAVRRAIDDRLVIVDMPFLSYQAETAEALRNAGRILKETGAQAVKVEGGDAATLERIEAMVTAGIPVMGHLGLTPQSVHRFGGYGVRGREEPEADEILRAARALEAAGCFGLVLEMVPASLAKRITGAVAMPTIGIGAGPACDGQVLVLPDMLGLNEGFEPKFLRHFAELGREVRRGVTEYVAAVRSGAYPADGESYGD